ncbi:Vesicle-associated membrane protein 1 [Eumeta japonica]|uniref:Vesicle-associated membrane protein 1 n=1 Tax=Eumeta variegata TaxID=151549 RepID=A0A4C1ZU36_EUMVA|nr:Vesicle-associated membrane protein 1 [Eumeta japonica]
MEEQGDNSATRVSTDNRLAKTKAKVNEVTDIMRINVEKILERDQRLTDLDDRAQVLQNRALDFNQQATRIKRKYWWKNLKMMLIIGAVGLVFLILIIVWATKGSGSTDNAVSITSTVAVPTNDMVTASAKQ